VLELEGVDPDGDNLVYNATADIALEGLASVATSPSGTGIFRWTPAASDAGTRFFDFTVSDGENTTVVSISIEVRANAVGVPRFAMPLGSGAVIDLGSSPCVDLDIQIEDDDAQVTIAQEEPLIDGATLTSTSGLGAAWHWCPTSAQAADSSRYTLFLSADDGVNPKGTKEFVIVLGAGTTSGPTLLINEVDYDNISTDTAEFVELYNASGKILPLNGLKVILVNGATSTPYQTIDLGAAGQLAIGQYLVIAGTGVTVPTSAKRVNPLWSQDQLQNGAPDGIAIIDDVTKTVVDALSYEGAVTAANIPGFAQPVSLVEGTALDAGTDDSNTATMSLCRIPSGADTNNAATDWTTCATLGVGKKNP
jgi:Lamin Tail Domain/Bacterial Ig domain